MMKMMVISAALVAAPLAFAAKDKVAVFDMQEAILNTNMAKAEMQAFKSRSDISKMISDADKLKKDIAALRTEINKGGAGAQEKQKSAEFKQADLELIVRKLNSEQQAAGKKIMDELGPHLESAVQSIVDAEGIGLLLDKRAAVH